MWVIHALGPDVGSNKNTKNEIVICTCMFAIVNVVFVVGDVLNMVEEYTIKDIHDIIHRSTARANPKPPLKRVLTRYYARPM